MNSNNKVWNSNKTVYVGNIDPQVTLDILYELFVQVAPISSIKYPKDKVLQAYQGYAFIDFFTEDDVQYVIKVMNNTVRLYGKLLKVRLSNYALSASTANASNKTETANVEILPVPKVFIKDIDSTTTTETLSSLFKKIGPVLKEPEFFYLSYGKLRCAYLYMKNYDDSDKAIKILNNSLVGNKRVKVDYAFKDNTSKVIKFGEDIDRLLNKEALQRDLIK
ncbi:hypothetical protein TPHA_0G01080 [Tetrapisispora phaffii CBS 4417]|uniref:RRM domain-containing protein n=1 Tax=Tetrapisispora phaffii (strain ATCC 24235 / CBS 4417 / NBRC 1672 / NRRL Y-8282 / UCD 70-5) TaxID=1071381 RepID=G8BVL7_TETPH|nr:hypothetical protein TPHA_0G01080 [Tetrapisispora phaffii CBS 4417]CCE63945.1 hypothetical protein TPHA_0G01080 [Tetrapisispora phaffii CBS 4417]